MDRTNQHEGIEDVDSNKDIVDKMLYCISKNRLREDGWLQSYKFSLLLQLSTCRDTPSCNA